MLGNSNKVSRELRVQLERKDKPVMGQKRWITWNSVQATAHRIQDKLIFSNESFTDFISSQSCVTMW